MSAFFDDTRNDDKKLFEFYFHKIGYTRIAIVSKLTLRSFALSLGIMSRRF